MDYYQRIQRAIDFIEVNLTENITLREVAEQAYCSLYHFHRLFQAIVDLSVKEYIRKRRLTRAARDLVETKLRVLDIALTYQYESAESFTRAFKKMYDLTPGKFRKNPPRELPVLNKINVLDYQFKYQGGIVMEPKILVKEEFKIIGVQKRISNEDGQNFVEVPAFWDQQIKAGIHHRLSQLPNTVSPYAELGMCMDLDDATNTFTYMIATEVKNADVLPADMVCRTIPTSKYAVFTAKGPLPTAIQETWQYIYQTWFPTSGYERTDGPDFELYDARCMDSDNAEVDIYIPIK